MNWVLALLLLSLTAEAFEHELQFLTKLRELSFYSMATKHGSTLLAREDLEDAQRMKTAVEHSKSFVALALNSRGAARETHWSAANQVLADELRSQPDPIAKFLLQTQVAFTQEQRAEWMVREAEIRSRSEDDWQTARSQLRKAIKGLRALRQQLSSPATRRAFAEQPQQAQEVSRNLDYQLARAYQHQAITYANGSTDRTNAATQALALLSPIAKSRVPNELVWKCRIDQIRCTRMLGQLDQVRNLIQKNAKLPAEFLGPLAAEGVRLALDAKQIDAALKLVQNPKLNNPSPEYQLARIETLVGAAKKEEGNKQFEQTAAQVSAELGKRHGVYWALRGEILLSRLASGRQDADAGSLKNAADTMLRSDSPEQAKELFIRAAEQAERSGDEKAFDYLFNAAVVDHREGNLESATKQFHQVAAKFPKHPRAPEAHLLAIFDAAALYQRSAAANAPNVGTALKRYEQLLQEHIHTWPEGETANQARAWSAKLAMARKQWKAASQHFKSITAGSKFEAAALEALRTMYADHKFEQTPAEVLAERRWLGERIQQANGEVRAGIALAIAQQAVAWKPFDYPLAEQVLQRHQDVLVGGGKPDATALLVVARAGKGAIRESQLAFSEGIPWSVDHLLLMLKHLIAVQDVRQNDSLQAMIKDVLQRIGEQESSMNEGDKLAIQQAIADVSPPERALATYMQLAKTHQNDFRIQQRYAELLSKQEEHQAAIDQWRAVVAKAKKRSREWFRGKLGVAQSHFAMGNKQQAQELIEYMQAIYPDLGGDELKRQFDSLLKAAKS